MSERQNRRTGREQVKRRLHELAAHDDPNDFIECQDELQEDWPKRRQMLPKRKPMAHEGAF